MFSIELEYIVEFSLNEEVTDEEIKNSIDAMISPLGGEVSYIIATLTEKMIGSYIILPPIIRKIKINGINHMGK